MGTLARNRLKIRRLHFNNQGLAKEAKSLLPFRNCEPHKKRIEYKKKCVLKMYHLQINLSKSKLIENA